MNVSFYFTIIILLLVTLTITFPEQMLQWISSVRRRFHQTLINYHGTLAARQLEQQLLEYAQRKNIPLDIVQEVMAERKQELIHRLGGRYVDDLLNEG